MSLSNNSTLPQSVEIVDPEGSCKKDNIEPVNSDFRLIKYVSCTECCDIERIERERKICPFDGKNCEGELIHFSKVICQNCDFGDDPWKGWQDGVDWDCECNQKDKSEVSE